MADDTAYETPAEEDTSSLRAGRTITLEEAAAELSALELRARQLARALETPATPIEMESLIDSLRGTSARLREAAGNVQFLARVVTGEVELAAVFAFSNEPWGAAARGSTRTDFGGPAIIPTAAQITKLARDAKFAPETTTYPEGMRGVGIGWESKAASVRRRRERDAAVRAEVLQTVCSTCKATDGQHCRTKNGRVAEQPHLGRQREAEAAVDARLSTLGDAPLAAPET